MKIKLALQISKAKQTRSALAKLRQPDDEEQQNETRQEQQDDRPQEERAEAIEDATSTRADTAEGKPVHIISQGRATTIPMPSHGIITMDDIINNHEPLAYEDTPEARMSREQTHYTLETFGASQAFVPSRATIVRKGFFTKLLERNEMIKRLKRLFSGKRCRLSPMSMRLIIAFTLHNFKGSDEGTTMTLAAAFLVIHLEMGLELSPEALGYGNVSESLFRAWKKRFSAEIFIKEMYTIREQKVKYLHVASDHGLRAKMDVLCKGISYAYVDVDGNRRIKFLAIDFDRCGHSIPEVVAALKKMVKKIKRLCPDVEFISLEGDNGGGGGVEAIFPHLIDEGVLEDWARFIICIMHALNKCIETGFMAIFGAQGMNMICILQLGYASIRVFKRIKIEGGLELLDEIKRKVVKKLMTDKGWKKEAAENCLDGLEKLCAQYEEKDIDEVAFFRNLQEPVWTRWGSTLAMAHFLEENWTLVYFMLVAVCQTKKASLSIAKTAGDALAMMKTKAQSIVVPPSDDDTSESTTETEEVEEHTPVSYPVHYAQVCFMSAIGTAFFDDAFATAMRADPKFGKDSNGYIARLQHVLIFYWKTKVVGLMDEDETNPDSWKNRVEFERYRKVIETMPSLGAVKAGGKEFFMRMPRVFFDNFLVPFKKHIESCWLGELLWPYMLAGNKEIARLGVNYLVNASERADMEAYSFNDPLVGETIQIDDHVPNQTITINTRSCLQYLTSMINDPTKLLEHKLIATHWNLLVKMASATQVVDLYDETTWDGVDYKPLVDCIHDQITPHMSQNQLLELQVQTHAQVSKNNTGEARRSADCILVSAIKHPLNKALVEAKRKTKTSQDEKDKINRVRGRERVAGCTEMLLKLLPAVDRALENTPVAERKRVIKEYETTTDRVSQDELQQQIKDYEKGINGKRVMRAAKNNIRPMNVTAAMGGTIVLSDLKKNQGHTAHVLAEIEERGIEPQQALSTMTWKALKDLLRKSEHTYMSMTDTLPQHITKPDDVKEIIPKSDKMKELLVSAEEEGDMI